MPPKLQANSSVTNYFTPKHGTNVSFLDTRTMLDTRLTSAFLLHRNDLELFYACMRHKQYGEANASRGRLHPAIYIAEGIAIGITAGVVVTLVIIR